MRSRRGSLPGVTDLAADRAVHGSRRPHPPGTRPRGGDRLDAASLGPVSATSANVTLAFVGSFRYTNCSHSTGRFSGARTEPPLPWPQEWTPQRVS